MAENPYFDKKALKELQDKGQGVFPLKPAVPHPLMANWPKELETVEPLTVAKVDKGSPASAVGHMMTPDGRLALRIILDSEAQHKFGVGGLTHRQAVSLMHRIGQVPDMESALEHAQRDVVILRKALKLLYAAAKEAGPQFSRTNQNVMKLADKTLQKTTEAETQ